MERIEGISGVGAAPVGAASARAVTPQTIARGPTVAPARPATGPERPETDGAGTAAGQVRAGGIGSDGRFAKLILAVQALRYGFGEDAPTARIEEMRAAAEEIFQIDGVPAPIEPAAEVTPEIDLPPVEASSKAASPRLPGAAPAEPGADLPEVPPAENAPATVASDR